VLVTQNPAPALREGRRRFCLTLLGVPLAGAALLSARAATGQDRRYTIAFANLTEEPGVTLEGTGFTGREIRSSFALAARNLPVDVVFYDNQRDSKKAQANAEDAIARRVDLYILYFQDLDANAAIAARLKAAGIPILAVNYSVPGAPLYTVDNVAAGRIAGEALGQVAARSWRGQATVAVIVGPVEAKADRVPERVQGVLEGLRAKLPGVKPTTLDTQGNPARMGALLGKYLAAHPGAKVLVAATDDATALAAKSTLEQAGRASDAAIASHGVDRNIHGGINDKKEIDPTNRGSIVIGSVAFYLDRYGYDVLPLALRMLRGEPVPPRTATRHLLITASNVFVEYPPYDMN
jgi:ABC-type sugar transport system substrate-binding protein